MVNPLCPLANLFCDCFLFGLLPRFLSGLLFSLGEPQIWLGDLRVVVVVGPVCFLDIFYLRAFMDQLCPCTNVFLTAYAHVRTEPQSDIGQTRGKKTIIQVEAGHLRENPQTPQQQETLQEVT